MTHIESFKKLITGSEYTPREEVMHSLTHWIGTIIVCLGSGCLITLAALAGGAARITSVSIYCVSMILLYCASTLYHVARDPGAKRKLKIFDHSSIYILIAGTYSPFLLINIKGWVGWTMFVIMWTMALAGILGKIFFAGRFKRLSLAVYLVMGWMIVLAIKPFYNSINLVGLIFLLIGGLLYSVGVYFYVRKDKEFYHGIWHIFVLAATIMHFFAVLYGSMLPLQQIKTGV